jgi:hypothetical protein
MRTPIAVLLAALALFLTICGAAQPRVNAPADPTDGAGLTVTAPADLTLTNADTGTRVLCLKGARSVTGTVPALGQVHGWVNGLGFDGFSLRLERDANGSLGVDCA